MKQLEVIDVKATPECFGPLVFHVFWACDHCGFGNTLQKKYSLLPPQATTCANCGKRYHYVFPYNYFKQLWEKLPQFRAFEERLFDKIFKEDNDAWSCLGKNLFFVISSLVLSGQKTEHSNR
jgi:hypothetical protein